MHATGATKPLRTNGGLRVPGLPSGDSPLFDWRHMCSPLLASPGPCSGVPPLLGFQWRLLCTLCYRRPGCLRDFGGGLCAAALPYAVFSGSITSDATCAVIVRIALAQQRRTPGNAPRSSPRPCQPPPRPWPGSRHVGVEKQLCVGGRLGLFPGAHAPSPRVGTVPLASAGASSQPCAAVGCSGCEAACVS